MKRVVKKKIGRNSLKPTRLRTPKNATMKVFKDRKKESKKRGDYLDE